MGEPSRSSAQSAWLLLPLFVGLYAAQGVTGSMVQTALPTVLRDSGMPLDRLGLLYVLFLPWALKFLWAPVVDRYSIARLGRRRSWLLACQLALTVCFLTAALLPPNRSFNALLAVLVLVALFASTQDIATDALAVDRSDTRSRGLVSGAGVFGGYLGFLLGIGVWLPVYAGFGWAVSMLVMAGCVAVLTIPTVLARSVDDRADRGEATRPSVLAALKRSELRAGLGFLVLYQCGLRLGIALMGPFLVDLGLSLTTIGWLKGTGGAGAGLLGALVGAWLVRRFGSRRCLTVFALLAAAIFAGFAAAAIARLGEGPVLIALVLGMGTASAFSFVALYAAMMGWCSRSQTGTDFALLQSADALLAIILAAVAGFIGQAFGHAANFAIAAGCLLVAAAATTRLPLLAERSPASFEPPDQARELGVMRP